MTCPCRQGLPAGGVRSRGARRQERKPRRWRPGWRPRRSDPTAQGFRAPRFCDPAKLSRRKALQKLRPFRLEPGDVCFDNRKKLFAFPPLDLPGSLRVCQQHYHKQSEAKKLHPRAEDGGGLRWWTGTLGQPRARGRRLRRGALPLGRSAPRGQSPSHRGSSFLRSFMK